MSPQRIRNIVLPLCAVLLAASCSTTRRLGSDEVLYTGVKKILIEPDSGVVLTPAAESAVKEPLSVAPNNPLYSPYLRTPLPVGLWAYNHLYTPKERSTPLRLFCAHWFSSFWMNVLSGFSELTFAVVPGPV